MPYSLKHLSDELRTRILKLAPGQGFRITFPNEKEMAKMYLLIRRWLKEYDKDVKSIDDALRHRIKCSRFNNNTMYIHHKPVLEYKILDE